MRARAVVRSGRSGGGHRPARLLATVMVMTLLMAACTRSDSETEIGTRGPAPASGQAQAGGPTTAAPGGKSAGSFGDLKDVCGPGDGAGSTAQGVTDDAIKVGTISDPGFTGRPGLNQELFDASKVFTAWCNAAGGINGREIEMTERDAKITEYKQRITEACQQDFMLVGGGGVFDDTGQDERLGCLLPEIPAYQVTSAARGADLAIRPLPNPLDRLSIGVYQYLGKRFPKSTKDVAFLTGNVPATVVVDHQNQEAVKSLGWKVTYQAQYNALGEASWTQYVQAMRSKRVKGLVYTGEPENFAKLLQAAADIDYHLDWAVTGANALDANFIKVGGDAIRDVFLISAFVPPFMAKQNPATQQYLDLFEQYLPAGKSEALLGMQSFSAWLLFATAVKQCGSEVTRKCVFDAAGAVTDWTGGGLHSASQPGKNESPRCGMVIEATPKGFVVPDDFKLTDGLFRCSDNSVVKLEDDYGKGAKLADVGKSLDDLE
jgi:ABC-type branched-subunit amino acid transport system substrate-binding protein